MTWLLIYVSAISLYDLRTRRIPNWYTLPLITAGMIVHFPGHLELWLACVLLTFAWANGWMGAGDVKLWIALLWALPDSSASPLLLLIFLSLFITSAIQILWQAIRRKPVLGVSSAAAWRTIPFLLMFWYVH